MALTELEIMEIFELVTKAKREAGQRVVSGTLVREGEEDVLFVPAETDDQPIISGISILYDQTEDNEDAFQDE